MGFLKKLEREVKRVGSQLDKELGYPTHATSSMPEKRAEAVKKSPFLSKVVQTVQETPELDDKKEAVDSTDAVNQEAPEPQQTIEPDTSTANDMPITLQPINVNTDQKTQTDDDETVINTPVELPSQPLQAPQSTDELTTIFRSLVSYVMKNDIGSQDEVIQIISDDKTTIAEKIQAIGKLNNPKIDEEFARLSVEAEHETPHNAALEESPAAEIAPSTVIAEAADQPIIIDETPDSTPPITDILGEDPDSDWVTIHFHD